MAKKRKTEAEMRSNILHHAKLMGLDGEVQKIFTRYDNLLRGCTNPQERYHIQVMGVAELHRCLGCPGALIVDGVEVLPADPNFTPPKE